MNYFAEAQELVRNLNQRMGPSPYDIAWMARLKGADEGPLWPDLLEWLLENQHSNGSWGGGIEYYHDRVICTLAAIIALDEHRDLVESEEAIRCGEHYLWHHLHLLPRDPFELVGFELIFPTLLSEAQSLGLDVPTHTCGYGEIQTAKLRLIPLEKLYSPNISSVYSLEFLGRSGEVDRLASALNINGALGNSPATTAYYLTLTDSADPRALKYLDEVRGHLDHIIPVYPFRTFELSWVLNNLAYSGLPIKDFGEDWVWESLYTELGNSGVGFDPTFGITDGDTTAVCCHVLLEAGYTVEPQVLTQFEDKQENVFRTYSYERNVSVSTNVHALDALHLMNDYPGRQQIREQVIIMLLNSRKYDMYWTDKWHTSPYYATSHAIIALMREGAYLAHSCQHTIDWLIHTQRADGSWGFFDRGTPEETAYVLMALLHYHRYTPVDLNVLHKGSEYLTEAYERNGDAHIPLWIVKCLYAPYDIIKSAIISSLMLYDSIIS